MLGRQLGVKYKMLKTLLFFSITICVYSALAQDSSATSDTNFISLPLDSLRFVVQSAEYSPGQNWWQKNVASLLGALLGTFGAGLIAYFSIKKTFKNSNIIEKNKFQVSRKEKEKKYCGLLFMIFSEFAAHDHDTPRLRNEIDDFLKLVEEHKKIIVDTPFTGFEVEFIKECRSNILHFDSFDSEIMTLLSHYINLISRVNYYLDLRRIKETSVYFSGKEEQFVEGVKEYFKEVNSLISALEEARKSLEESILNEINRFPHSDIDIHELMQKIKHETT